MSNLLTQYTDADRIQAKRSLSSKKRTLEALSQILGESVPEANAILDGLVRREKLGTTALGNSVAIPHARAKIDTPVIAVLTLLEGIDFDSPDSAPVDLFIGIAVPEETPELHLQLLANIATQLKDKTFCEVLRQARTDKDLFDSLMLGTVVHVD